LREAAKLTIDEVGEKLECSASKISRIETGHVGVTPRDVRDLLDLYDVPADQLGQQLAAGHVGDQPPLDLEHRQPRVRCDDADVSPESDLQAAAQGVPGHRGDDRDGELGPDEHGALPGGLGRAVAGRGHVGQQAEPLAVPHRGERAEVQARAEVRTLA